MTDANRRRNQPVIPLYRRQRGRQPLVRTFAACAASGLLAPPLLPASAVGMENLTPFPFLIAPESTAVYRGTGMVTTVDTEQKMITVRHGAVAALKWGERTTTFAVKDGLPLAAFSPNDEIAFEFSPGEKDSYIITSLRPIAK